MMSNKGMNEATWQGCHDKRAKPAGVAASHRPCIQACSLRGNGQVDA